MRFPDEEPETWEDDWEGWTESRRPLCDYCGLKGHEIRQCPVMEEENG